MDALESLLAEEAEPVQLILIDLSLVNRFQNYAEALRTHYPGLRVALLSQGEGGIDPAVLRRFDPRQMRGVLALDVRLDIFLSSLAVVLNGGTHYSGLNLDRPALQSRQHHLARADEGDQGVPRPCVLSRLTGRELEILAHVARGRQNKNIAAVLGLSEHTVKIHLHNVITKLRVHNRTEAAAIFLRETDTRGDHLPQTPCNIG
jgi:DNA-binding NarL/FixJ family response regulator